MSGGENLDDELMHQDQPSPAGFPVHDARPHQFQDSGNRSERLWELMSNYLDDDVESIQKAIVNHVEYTLARTRYNFDNFGAYLATAYSMRDRLIEYWNDTHQYLTATQQKRVYYLSLEFLVGRSLQNAVVNMGLEGKYCDALRELGYDMERLYDEEKDAALGNGGLGRLAACFLDSLATQNLPGWGYGLRYEYGMFQQRIVGGFQVESPDYWLNFGNPWEIPRVDVQYPVRFYGYVTKLSHEGKISYRWEGGEIVRAVAFDNPIPGYGTKNTCNIRLWSSKPPQEFDLGSFNQGDYLAAVEAKHSAENITRVLYPNDNTIVGKELRLKQQYFFVCATLHDIVRRFKKTRRSITSLPDFVTVHLNDTHPSISIAELMRMLIDEEHLDWATAWGVTTKVHAFTNHTVLPEALERWPVDMFTNLLPRHMQLIYEINHEFLELVRAAFPDDDDRVRHMSLIDEGPPRMIRMAHLAIVGSYAVNGVARIHTDLLKASVFRDFVELWPDRFHNKTNGVTPRRWILQANPSLSRVLTKWSETSDWVTDLERLRVLEAYATNRDLQREFRDAKLANKERLASIINKVVGIKVNPHALFDVQCKRIHEYKRQYLNIISVVHRYFHIKSLRATERADIVPRVVIFAGKAAPGYDMAKRVIKLINAVADVVNADRDVGDLLKVVFIPNYNVSLAEVIVPANDISQHISTAGTEASGTSNMKFVMNGGLIIGTLDGANVEIREHCGEDNMFVFGARVEEVEGLRELMRRDELPMDDRFYNALAAIESGAFGSADFFRPLVESLRNGRDYYLIGADFASYLEAQERVDALYRNEDEWRRRTIEATARMGYFSSDRTIKEYASQIWRINVLARDQPHFAAAPN